jgi:hypothetical protein
MWKPFITHEQGEPDELRAEPGDTIDHAIRKAIAYLELGGRATVLNFNGARLLIDTDDEEVLLARFWHEFRP